MVTFHPRRRLWVLAALPRLESSVIRFLLANPHPYRIRPPSVPWTVLPALTSFEFKGANEYLEDLVARIYAPQLDQININYLNQLVDSKVAHLSEFFNQSVGTQGNLIQTRVCYLFQRRGLLRYE